MSELYHHGILGQRWGKQNGPPYPLDYSDHSAVEKAHISKKDTKWATKNRKKITDSAYKQSKRELNDYANELLRNPNARNANGKVSAATINAFNRRMAQLMSEKVADLRSPEGRVIHFVAKRGEMGVHMALADVGYDMSQLKNGVWNSGRIAYRQKIVERVESSI